MAKAKDGILKFRKWSIHKYKHTEKPLNQRIQSRDKVHSKGICQIRNKGFTKEIQNFTCSFSAGISEFKGSKDAATILEMSDKALLEAKSSGRNKINREDVKKG